MLNSFHRFVAGGLIYLLICNPMFRIYGLICCLFYIGLSIFSDGLLDLEIRWHFKRKAIIADLKNRFSVFL